MKKEYTPWRRALAWIGFICILAAFPALLTVIMWANDITGLAIKDAHAEESARQSLITHCRTIGGEPIWSGDYPNLIECDF